MYEKINCFYCGINSLVGRGEFQNFELYSVFDIVKSQN